MGKIYKVYEDYDRLIIKHFDEQKGEYVKTSVVVTDDTTIISASGDTMRLGHLREDDEVFINGYTDDDLFIADKIIELD